MFTSSLYLHPTSLSLLQLRLVLNLPLRINIHLRPPGIIPRPIHIQITFKLGLPLLKERPNTLLLIPTPPTRQQYSPTTPQIPKRIQRKNLLRSKHMTQNPRLNQMRLLDTRRRPPHQRTIQRPSHRTHQLGHLTRQLHRPLHDPFLRGKCLGKETPEVR